MIFSEAAACPFGESPNLTRVREIRSQNPDRYRPQSAFGKTGRGAD
jgi:hypothetical protein